MYTNPTIILNMSLGLHNLMQPAILHFSVQSSMSASILNMKIKQLIEFVCNFIEDQLHKYDDRATFGFGPDAEMNSTLIADQIDELSGFAKELLQMLEKKSIDKVKLNNIFNQIYFYHNLEYVRYHARWLVYEKLNPAEFKKIQEQKNQLEMIAKAGKIDVAVPLVALTEKQIQYEYDSRSITFFVLNLALSIKNPEFELDSNVPFATVNYLKKESIGENWALAQTIRARCLNFLEGSLLLSKSPQEFLAMDKVRAQQDLLTTIRTKISDRTKISEQDSASSKWMTLFADVAITTAAAVILDEAVNRLIH